MADTKGAKSRWALIQRKCSCLFHGDKTKRGSMKFKPNKKSSKSTTKGATLTRVTRLDSEGGESNQSIPKMSSVVEALLEQKGPKSGNTAEVNNDNVADTMFGNSVSFNPDLQYDSSLDLRIRVPDEKQDTINGEKSDGSEFSLGERNQGYYNSHSTFGIPSVKHGRFIVGTKEYFKPIIFGVPRV